MKVNYVSVTLFVLIYRKPLKKKLAEDIGRATCTY